MKVVHTNADVSYVKSTHLEDDFKEAVGDINHLGYDRGYEID